MSVPAVECEALHCDEEHPAVDPQGADEALRHAISALAEAFHRQHDDRFAWRLCSDDVCREVAFALGVRS